MPNRSPIPFFQASEKSSPISVNLGAGVVTSQSILPTKAHGQSIVGMEINLAVTMTQSAAANWTPDLLFNSMKIVKGSNTLINPLSYKQFTNLFNALTGLSPTSTTYFNDPQSAGALGQSTSTMDVFLPLKFTTDSPVVTTFSFNAYSSVTNGTAGSVSIIIQYFYSSQQVKDDEVKIVTTPSNLNAATDIDVSQYFSELKPVKEVWIDVTTDSNLTYQTFTLGNTVVFDKTDAFNLRALTTVATWQNAITGFYKAQTMEGVTYPAQGSTSAAKPQLVINLSVGTIAPTYYLFIKN